MSTQLRQHILHANGLYLIVASVVGFFTLDVPGIFFGRGPESHILSAPYAGIGFIEAHGLAFIIGVLLWRAAPLRSWHVTALAAQALLGTCNLVFGEIFPATGAMTAGYVFTSFHWIFVALQLAAAWSATSRTAITTPTEV